MNDDALNNLEETIDQIPDEVRDFIFGEDLKAVKKELADLLVTEDEKNGLSNMIMFYLLGSKTIVELNDFIGTLTVSDDNKLLIGKIIQEKIIDELLLLIEVHQEMDADAGTDSIKSSSLSSIADRLKTASITTPAKRDYGINKEAPAISSEQAPVRAIDPYHEAIDNE